MSDNFEDMLSKIKNNTDEENRELAQQLHSNLSQDQASKLNSLLSNSELMNKLMASDAVKNILNKLGGEQNGHQ
ncbi:MAG: hypothetical protein IJZ35_07020 [Clostridia bacterium]|nr:hypothetical protein [Clostridia bacterium]